MKGRNVWYLVIDRELRRLNNRLSIDCYVCRVQALDRTKALKIFRDSDYCQPGKVYGIISYRSQGMFLVREQRLIDRTVPILKIHSLR